MGADWSAAEVEATVADYFDMLNSELRGEPYSKTEHRHSLKRLLSNRTDAAIELKHQNISAVLVDICRMPPIKGYLPRRNYQHLLAEVVLAHLEATPGLIKTVELDVVRPVEIPEVEDILKALVDPPKRRRSRLHAAASERPGRQYDYLALEAVTRERGKEGEEFALRFEKARLLAARLDRFVDSVRHSSVEDGDGLGYDILSFEKNGAKRYIEVKATKYSAHVPFYFSSGERDFSLKNRDQYHLYRVFDLGVDPHLFIRSCPLDAPYYEIEPTQYRARVA